MAAPTPAEFRALVPDGASENPDDSTFTASELRLILLGDSDHDSLPELMARWMENWVDVDSGEFSQTLKDVLCDLQCVRDELATATSTTSTSSTSTTSTSTTSTSSTSTTSSTTSSTTTAAPSTEKTFTPSTSPFGSGTDNLVWSNLDAGTYRLDYVGGYVEYETTKSYYTKTQGVSLTVDGSGTNALTGDLVQYDVESEATTNGVPKSFTVSQGGSVTLSYSKGWPTATYYFDRGLTFRLTKQ
jgi:hypothetical protein